MATTAFNILSKYTTSICTSISHPARVTSTRPPATDPDAMEQSNRPLIGNYGTSTTFNFNRMHNKHNSASIRSEALCIGIDTYLQYLAHDRWDFESRYHLLGVDFFFFHFCAHPTTRWWWPGWLVRYQHWHVSTPLPHLILTMEFTSHNAIKSKVWNLHQMELHTISFRWHWISIRICKVEAVSF